MLAPCRQLGAHIGSATIPRRRRLPDSRCWVTGVSDGHGGLSVQHPLPNGDAEIVLITHKTIEANLRSAVDVFKRLEIVSAVQNSIRVEE